MKKKRGLNFLRFYTVQNLFDQALVCKGNVSKVFFLTNQHSLFHLSGNVNVYTYTFLHSPTKLEIRLDYSQRDDLCLLPMFSVNLWGLKWTGRHEGWGFKLSHCYRAYNYKDSPFVFCPVWMFLYSSQFILAQNPNSILVSWQHFDTKDTDSE